MKHVICRLESLSPFDLQGTAEHLSAMAAKGWRLERIKRYFWRYRKAAPANVHYAVTGPPAAGEDEDLENRLFFQELCAAAGWEAVTDWAELEIYASEQKNPTPLETDQALLLLLVLAMVFIILSPENSQDASLLALQLLGILIILIPAYPIKVWLDRKGVPLRGRLLGIFLLFTALILCLDYYAPRLPHRSSPPEVPSYTWDGRDWDAEPQPLTLEDLTGEPWDHVRRRISVKGRTPFAVKTLYRETAAREDGERAYLQYTLLETSGDGLCRAVWEDLLDLPNYRNYVPEDPAPWGAEAAYRQRWSDPSHDDVLLLWPGRIVTVHIEELPLDDGQKALTAARLDPEDEKEDAR